MCYVYIAIIFIFKTITINHNRRYMCCGFVGERQITGLAIDTEENNVYLSCRSRKKIEMLSADGNVTTIHALRVTPAGLVVDKSKR